MNATQEEIFPLPRQLVGEGELFLMTIPDNSMTAKGISTGDWAIVRSDVTPGPGDTVAVTAEGVTRLMILQPDTRGQVAGRAIAVLHYL